MRSKPLIVFMVIMLLLLGAACQPGNPTQAPLRSPQAPTPLPTYPGSKEPAPTSPHIEPTIVQSTATAIAVPVHPTMDNKQGLAIARIWLFPDKNGWASDLMQTKVFHTRDGGKTWRDRSPAALMRGQNHLFFLDGETAWISQNLSDSSSYIWHSTDGGAKWLRFTQTNPGGMLSFSNTLNGFMLISLQVAMNQESVEILQTADGGAIWTVRWRHLPDEIQASLPIDGTKENLLVLNENNILVTGTWPVPKSLYAYQSDNAAFSWKALECDGLPELGTGDMWTAQTPLRAGAGKLLLPVRAFASVGVDKTFFCESTDGGQSWTYLSELDATVLHSFTSTGVGLSAGANHIYRSEDGGKTWQELPFNLPSGQGIVSLSLADAEHAYLLLASLQSGPYAPAFLYASEDGGKTWVLVDAEIVS